MARFMKRGNLPVVLLMNLRSADYTYSCCQIKYSRITVNSTAK